ncbi:hypothetical protein Ancab_025874 [Ancistrocladus abbreviatus]
MVSFSQNSISSSSTFEEKAIKHKPVSSIMSSSSSSSHLHSVQKSSPPSKSSKKSAAADQLLPPASKQPRVYRVKPIHFRQLVQQLTGAPEFQQPTTTTTKRLQTIAPPTLQLDFLPSARAASSYSYTAPGGGGGAAGHVDQEPAAEAVDCWNASGVLEQETGALRLKRSEGSIVDSSGNGTGTDFLGGLSLSPNFQAWWSTFALLSPGSLDLSNTQDQQRTTINFE